MATEAPPAPPTAIEPKAPPPIPAGEKPPQDYLGDITGELADMDAATPVPPSPTPRRDERGKFTKPPDKPAEAVKPPEKAPEKAPEKPVETPPEEAPKPVRAAELRTAYDGLKKKVKDELEPELQSLRAKVEKYEKDGGDLAGPVLEKVKSLETRNKELEDRIALIDYESSQEFGTKYEEPYRQMWNRATNAFAQLTVKEQTGTDAETGEPTYRTRRATEEDLIKLGALPLSELDEVAGKLFGPSAPRAVQYIEKLRDLAEAKQTALVEAKKKAGEWKSQQTLESQTRQRTNDEHFREVNKALQEKFPKAFKPEDNDPEDAAAHLRGFALADLLFLDNSKLTPEQVEALPSSFRDTVKAKKPLTDFQKVQLHALARLKIANHDRKVAQLKKATARIAELEKALKEYEASEPSTERAGGTPRTTPKPWDEEVRDELAAMDRRS